MGSFSKYYPLTTLVNYRQNLLKFRQKIHLIFFLDSSRFPQFSQNFKLLWFCLNFLKFPTFFKIFTKMSHSLLKFSKKFFSFSDITLDSKCAGSTRFYCRIGSRTVTTQKEFTALYFCSTSFFKIATPPPKTKILFLLRHWTSKS